MWDINNSEDAHRYYQNAPADAIHCYQSVEKYLDKDKNIRSLWGYSSAY
jgi:hypothetical protein